MASTQTRLLVTLLYSWTFEFPLKLDEWTSRLYSPTTGPARRDSLSDCALAVVALLKQTKVRMDGAYFAPDLKEHTIQLHTLRAQRHAYAQKKRAEIEPLIRFCRWLPWVAGVAITGSVAVNNAKRDADVDLLVVCTTNRLWLVRPILIFFSQLYGKRRTWRGEEGNSWCFNLWLEQHTLSVSPSQRSLYIGYEVCQAQWLISKANSKELFFTANRWVQTILPRLYVASSQHTTPFTTSKIGIGIPLLYNLIDLSNYLSYMIQYHYMRRHMTRERVTLHFAAFHPRDTGKMIYRALGTLLKPND